MKCLDNFFGVKGICAADFNPRSGLWLEMLEGMSLRSVADVASKHPNAEQLLKETLYFAGQQMMEDVKQAIFPDLYDNLIVEEGRMGIFNDRYNTDTDDYWPVENLVKGLRVRKCRTQFSKLKIYKLYFLADTTATGVTVSIKDGAVTKTITIDIEAGKIKEVIIDFTADTEQVDITWDTTAIEPAKGTTFRTMRTKDCGCSNSTYEYLAGVGISNDVESSELYGIAADILIECDVNNSLCMILNQIKMALLYRWGIRLLDEHIASDRMNFLAIHSKEWAIAKRQEWWEMQYVPLLQAKKEGVKNYLKSIDSTCFNCGGLRYGYVHP